MVSTSGHELGWFYYILIVPYVSFSDNCGLLDAGVTQLFLNGEARWPGIKHLYLDANGISDANALAKFFAVHRHQLKSLYLSMNRLGDIGARTVCAALIGSTTLKRFSMGSNRMTDASAQVIVDMVLTCPRVVLVDVGCYKSTFDMGEKPNKFARPEPWIALIEQHKPLKHLDLLRNCMSLDAAHSIVSAAKMRGGLNVYASMNDVLRDKLSYVEGIPDKDAQKVLKHPKRVIHIDSIYRNRN